MKEETTDKAQTKKKRGGRRANAGRKSKAEALTNYGRAMRMLDDSIEAAIQVLIDGLYDDDPVYKLKCAEILLKKTLPDKKRNEFTGADGGPIQITHEDIKTALLDVTTMIKENKTGKYIASETIIDAEEIQ